MESFIAEVRLRRSACDLLPTTIEHTSDLEVYNTLSIPSLNTENRQRQLLPEHDMLPSPRPL
jgi:hypothetical protein